MRVAETIEYIGAKELGEKECLLAPWSLCQFDSGEGCEVVFPEIPADGIWDLYEDSSQKRCIKGGHWHVATDGGDERFQLGISDTAGWIEYRNPNKKLKVRRWADKLESGLNYIDITDRAPDEQPNDKGVCYSLYSDPDLFMEIEAAGGAPLKWKKGDSSTVVIYTKYECEN
jgi:hypothetical protein